MVNDWSLEKENRLKIWIEKCKMSKWLHKEAYNYNIRRFTILGIISIIFNGITGSTIFSRYNSEVDLSGQFVIIIGSISVISTLTSSLQTFMDYGKVAEKHKYQYKQYNIYINNIDEQLIQEPKDRENGIEFIKNMNLKLNELIRDAPCINNSIWKLFKKKYKQNNIIDSSKGKINLELLKKNNVSIKIENEIKNENEIENEMMEKKKSEEEIDETNTYDSFEEKLNNKLPKDILLLFNSLEYQLDRNT